MSIYDQRILRFGPRLADAGARVRLTLRNPLDTATRTHTTLSVGSLMQGAGQ